MHAEFSSQLINYAVLTLEQLHFHCVNMRRRGVGRAGCQAPAETLEQQFECWMVFVLT